MLIRVLRFRGRAPDIVIEAVFTEAGGTIGRSPECTLALPDPERHVSRIQAEISFLDGKFILVERGVANPVQCNGEVVTAGQAVALRDGDELHVGDYVLRVEFGRTEFSQTKTSAAREPVTGPASAEFAPTAFNADSPLASAVRNDPRGVSGKANTEGDVPHSGAFPPPPETPDTQAAAQEQEQEMHSRFPLPPAVVPDTAFRSWHNPEGIGPTMIVGRHESRLAPAKDTTGPVEAREKIAGLVNQAANAHQQHFVPIPKSHTTGFLQELNRKVLDAKPSAPLPEEPPAGLLQALLFGAGLQNFGHGQRSDGELDEEMMRRIGALLRLFAQGFIDLLATRAMFKSEMRAEMTIISAHENNNPLKFSPDATTALNYLLASRTMPGFMRPEAAVQDAVNDLVAHQAGVTAGVRTALHEVLQRLNPQALEKRMAARSVFGSMLPMSRKAKLWESFGEIFSEVSQEAQDDFETLFGREFVKAYETQIRRLEAGG